MNGTDIASNNINNIKSEAEPSVTTPQVMWSTPLSTQGMRPRPVTMHDGYAYSMGEATETLSAWDPSALYNMQPTPGSAMSRPLSVHQDYYTFDSSNNNNGLGAAWQKPCDDSSHDLQLDGDMTIGQAYTSDDAIRILNLPYTSAGEPLTNDSSAMNPRRLSGSSFTMSTSGGLSDMPSYDDFSADLSDAPSLSDYPPPSNRNSLLSTTQLSPVPSPRLTPQTRSELVRTQSRGRASPSPRPGLRATPYCLDGPRNKRWSTGSYGTMPSRRSTPYGHHTASGGLNMGTGTCTSTSSGSNLDPFGPRLPQHASPAVENSQLPLNMGNLRQATLAASASLTASTSAASTLPSQNPYFLSATSATTTPAYNRHSMILPTQYPSPANSMVYQHPHMDVDFSGLHNNNHYAGPGSGGMVGPPVPTSHTVPSHIPLSQFHGGHHQMQLPHQNPHHQHIMSHSIFRMLQSNGDAHALHHGHYADLSDPPDLYASLNEEQLAPPPEDMNPADPDMVPHEQELRFSGDLYTPRWVRGHGNKREGWCGICKPGRWLVLKNSAFWYDKSFTHGISAATGNAFQEPLETRRMDGNPDVWEGLCSSCNEWIALVSSKKKGTTWFRHAYKCHTHPKIKDAPKRKRESSHNRLNGGGCGGGGSGLRSSPGPLRNQPRPTSAVGTPLGTPLPHTPMTPPQSHFVPLETPGMTAGSTTTAGTPSRHVPAPIQIPLPVSLGMTIVSASPAPPMPSVTSMPSMPSMDSPGSGSNNNNLAAAPPIPPRSHLRMSRQGTPFDAMVQQQQQHQQPRVFLQQQQHVRPPPPPPQRSVMPAMPLTPVPGLGNMI